MMGRLGSSAEGLPASDRRQFILGGLLLAAVAVAFALKPRRVAETVSGKLLDEAVSTRIGPYRYATSSGLVVPPAGDLTERIYDQILTRVYVADDRSPVMLLIAYGSAHDAGLAVHRPEACYPAVGYSITPTQRVALSGIGPGAGEASYLTATLGDQVEQVYFWTRIGQRFPSSPLLEKMEIFSANARGILPDGVLVRMSVRSNDPGPALKQMQEFNEMLLRSVGSLGRRFLLGSRRLGE
jgi:EpsI family protein